MNHLSSIAQFLKAELITNINIDELVVNDILLDSRKLLSPTNTLFIALNTNRNDGHKYIVELYEKGIRYFMISHYDDSYKSLEDAVFLLVKNTLDSFQRMVVMHRNKFNIPVIGITGSNGKTIVKEWLFQMLYRDKHIVRSPKSYNSQIGVPLSVWQMSDQDQLAIFEAGISEPNEMERLQKMIKPTIGVFTNIGSAHDESFINITQKAGEKLNLFKFVDTLIYCSDYYPIVDRCVASGLQQKVKTYTWGRKNIPNLKIINITKNDHDTVVSVEELEGDAFDIKIPFVDDASIENAIHCWCTLRIMGYEIPLIQERLLLLTPIGMRLEMKDGINNCSVIDDSYSADINSLKIALDFMQHQKQLYKYTLILSDILQSGRDENELYKEISDLLKLKNITKLIGIGPSISRNKGAFNMPSSFFPTAADFIQQYDFSDFNSEIILLKGARVFHFEKISKVLQQKTHETVMEINLNALVDNVNYYKSKLNPNVKLMAMVKAFAYGSGSFEVANVLQFHNIDYLAVAYVDEGVELRKAGITLPIMVMHPEPHSYDTMIRHQLEPEISSFTMLDMLEEALRDFDEITPIAIHLKMDTGMHRLGFDQGDLKMLIGRLQGLQDHLYIKSVFSHLAASEDAFEDVFTKLQIERVEQMHQQIQQEFHYPIMKHILNTSGISRFPNAQFDMVRLGIGMYGITGAKSDAGMLQNVCTLRTKISQIKTIAKGDTVGYNRKWTAPKDSSLGIIPIGYADGLNRAYGNEVGKVMINGELAPIVGVICMDMCMIDLSDISAKVGDEVVVFGDDYPVTIMSEVLQTIPYEVLTGISRRVKRVYFQE
jgi:Alr-MurF fusion protein